MYNIEYKIDIYLKEINWITNDQKYQYIVDEKSNN